MRVFLTRLLLVVLVSGMALGIFVWFQRGEVIEQDYASEANLEFTLDALPPEQRVWYERLWENLENNTRIEGVAASNNTYLLGRVLYPYLQALYTAFRATGDVRLLDEMDRLMEIARTTLSDSNGDGYLNWVWTQDPTETVHYGTDLHEMDDIFTHSMVAFFAYVMRQNQDVRPAFGQRADFWQDYVINHYIAKWTQRGRGVFRVEKSLTHAYAHLMVFHYYLYRLTGNSAYLREAEQRADNLDAMMVLSDNGAFMWDHRVPNIDHAPLGCQLTDYARYTLAAFQQMAFEDFSYYADDAYMQQYAATIRENLLQQGGEVVAVDICGKVGNDAHSPSDYVLSLMTCLAQWDASGEIERESLVVLNAVTRDIQAMPYVAACMVALTGQQ